MTCRHYDELIGGCDEMEYGIDHTWCEPCPYAGENANTVKVVDLLQLVKT